MSSELLVDVVSSCCEKVTNPEEHIDFIVKDFPWIASIHCICPRDGFSDFEIPVILHDIAPHPKVHAEICDGAGRRVHVAKQRGHATA